MATKTYLVKEIFGPTLQGEGSLAGRVTAFLRFAGCNMWDGRAETKADSACPYCDTDFVGGERLTAKEILLRLKGLVPEGTLITISGGEPMLQVDYPLVATLARHFPLAVETNGTKPIPHDIRPYLHVTCSPKVPPGEIKLRSCDDLKVLYPHPHPGITPEAFADFPARSRWLQPVNDYDAINLVRVAEAIDKLYELNGRDDERPPWALSVQMHKVVGVA